ncbi:hypothetical protein ASPZODRAFT_140773 [Penicilliopsis zonata CBS 506.65]|uniref:WW domain-containing protein n=1 Tax=Penicilliopsis zonata CBS 506.65 TaxID=1073090 RepID=A0A1L9SN06_9EURO|nr:hypothetical protein ASPZODRAFT_140773 [Penicilliopsis zonata CBS 506.65]OJJ48481.1 hypothetical protein ASPZODRAFT_140773 [Penicilliopsis zonata CBS 506.65]
MEYVQEEVVDRWGPGGRDEFVEEETVYDDAVPRYAPPPPAGPPLDGPPGPPLPPNWFARWDDRDGCWFYENEITGETSWDRPPPPPGWGYGGGPPPQDDYVREEIVEERVDDYGYRQESLGEEAAEWMGRKVGEVERIPQDIADIPEDVADWAGREVGKVERFDDNIDYAYDEGKYEETANIVILVTWLRTPHSANSTVYRVLITESSHQSTVAIILMFAYAAKSFDTIKVRLLIKIDNAKNGVE